LVEAAFEFRCESAANPLWHAPRIHGELLKLGFEVAQSSVAKYIVKRRGLSRVAHFLRKHAPNIAAMDLFVFQLLDSSCSMPRHHPARAPAPSLDQRHGKPDRGVDRKSDHRDIPLE